MSDTQPTRLLVIALNFAPELTGIGKYAGEMTEWLGAAGADIRVVTAPPYYPAWRIRPPYTGRWYAREQTAGSKVYRCPLYVPRRPGGAARLAHLLSFALTSLPVTLWLALRWRPQLILVIEPPLVCAPGALLAAWLSGGRAWLHVQDFEVDAAFELGLLRSTWTRRLMLGIERWLLRRFDRVSSISQRMLLKLGEKGARAERIVSFPNWVDTKAIAPLAGPNALRAELGIAEALPVLLYSGNMGEKQGLELLVAVAGLLAGGQPCLMLLCGDGAVRARIEAAAAGLANIRFLPLQPGGRLNELLNLAEVHLLPQRADAEDLVMPSKLTAIMASGRPVVATARAQSEVAKVAAVGGLVVPPGDAMAFAGALRRLLDDGALRARLGGAGREYAVANWDRQAVLQRLRADVDACIA